MYSCVKAMFYFSNAASKSVSTPGTLAFPAALAAEFVNNQSINPAWVMATQWAVGTNFLEWKNMIANCFNKSFAGLVQPVPISDGSVL